MPDRPPTIVHSPAPTPVRPTSQYVRLFSGLRRSTSREYLVLLADDQMPERDVGTAVYGEGPFPTSAAAFQAQCRGWRERAQAGHPADWVRGVERLHRLPAHAGVPQHRWGVFLNDFDQLYMAAAAGLSVPPTSAGIRLIRWPCSNVIQRARWT